MPNERPRPSWGLIAFLVLMTPAAVTVSFCFGFIPALHHLALLIVCLRSENVAGSFHARAVLLSSFSHFLLLWLFATSASLFPESAIGHLGAAVVGATLHAVVLAPFAFFVPAHLDVRRLPAKSADRPHPMPSIEVALAQWEVLRLPERAAIVTLRIAPTIGAALVLLVARETLSNALAFLLMSWTYGVGTFFYSHRVVKVYLRTRRAEPDTLPSRRHLISLATIAGALLLAVGAYGAWSTTEPTPMRRCDAPHHLRGSPLTLHISEEATRLPGGDLEASLSTSSVSITSADGGGVGEVFYRSAHGGGSANTYGVEHSAIVDITDAGFDVYMGVGQRWAMFSVDAAGVRTDDGIARRVRHGLGLPALVLFILGFILVAISGWLLGAGVRASRRLRSIRDVEELTSSEKLGAMEGTLHGERLKVRGGKVVGAGEVRVQLGGRLVRLRLPEGGVRCVGDDADEGRPVLLVGRFAQVVVGRREGTLPWPEDAQLLLGEPAALAERLLRRATRPARLLSLAAALTALGSLIMVWLNRM